MTVAAFANARAQQRQRLIKTVQTGRSCLGLDEDTYRDLLAAKSGGLRSAKELSTHQLEAVIKHMRDAGFIPKKPAGVQPREHRTLCISPEAQKARALWLWLHQIGIVKDPSERALSQFAKRTCGGVDALQWARRPDKLIEGIKAWAARVALPVKLDERIAGLVAAGKLPASTTRELWIIRRFPTRDPATFDALHGAWIALDEVEHAGAH